MLSDPSVLIESINAYRHWLDAATLLVVIGLIGEYRKSLWKLIQSIKSRDWKRSKLLFLLVLFPVIVVIGVAAEFWVNFQVSSLENAWELTQLPRRLTVAQQKEVAEKIKPFSGTHFDIEMQQDIEPMLLLDEIENALLLAGWEEQSPRPGIQTFNRMNRPAVGTSRTVAGVWVLWPEPKGEPFKSAAMALQGALEDKNIRAALVTMTKPDAYDADKIHVWVGGRPILTSPESARSEARPIRRRYPKAPAPKD